MIVNFGDKGDYVTSPKISSLFSEMIAIWIISSWESFGKPNKLSIVELGPGDGSLINTLLKSFKKFPEFNSAKEIFLYEISGYLKKIQKRNISTKDVRWITNLNKIKKGPVIFFLYLKIFSKNIFSFKQRIIYSFKLFYWNRIKKLITKKYNRSFFYLI